LYDPPRNQTEGNLSGRDRNAFVDRPGYLHAFQKYGTIEAELFYVSPDAQEDQKIGLVYKIKSRPNRFKIRVKEKDIPLSPGMAVTAEIKTGERRVIEFFISPFIKHVDESLTLR
jgi:hemolysin D